MAYRTINPATGKVVKTYDDISDAALSEAIDVAQACLLVQPSGASITAGRIAVPARIRALDEIAGIQVNFCRMPTCLNFGKPPGPIKRGRGGAVNGWSGVSRLSSEARLTGNRSVNDSSA
jgi:hypothetical protein